MKNFECGTISHIHFLFVKDLKKIVTYLVEEPESRRQPFSHLWLRAHAKANRLREDTEWHKFLPATCTGSVLYLVVEPVVWR